MTEGVQRVLQLFAPLHNPSQPPTSTALCSPTLLYSPRPPSDSAGAEGVCSGGKGTGQGVRATRE